MIPSKLQSTNGFATNHRITNWYFGSSDGFILKTFKLSDENRLLEVSFVKQERGKWKSEQKIGVVVSHLQQKSYIWFVMSLHRLSHHHSHSLIIAKNVADLVFDPSRKSSGTVLKRVSSLPYIMVWFSTHIQ